MLAFAIATTLLATQTAAPIQLGRRVDAARLDLRTSRAGRVVAPLSSAEIKAFLASTPASDKPSGSVDEGITFTGGTPVVPYKGILRVHGTVSPNIDGTGTVEIEGKDSSEDPESCLLTLYLKAKTSYLVVVNGTPSGGKAANVTLTDQTMKQTLASQLVPGSGHAAFVLSPSPSASRVLWLSTDLASGYVSISSIQIHEFK